LKDNLRTQLSQVPLFMTHFEVETRKFQIKSSVA